MGVGVWRGMNICWIFVEINWKLWKTFYVIPGGTVFLGVVFLNLNLLSLMGLQSFIDRLARAVLLKDTAAGMSPAYNPPDASLQISTFTTFLTSVDTANDLVDTQEGSYSTQATTRVATVKTVKARSTQIMARLKSNSAWASEYHSAKLAADKVRGVKPPKAKPTPDEPTPTQVQKTKATEQAYAEISASFDKLIAIATGAAGYATGVPTEISSASLTSLSTSLKSSNSALSLLDGSLGTSRQKRKLLYYGPKGLQEKFQGVKDSVKQQYGQASAEYLSVKGIKW